MRIRIGVIACSVSLLVACNSGSDSPTAPANVSAMALSAAAVIVEGQTVNGLTLHPGHGGTGGTRFEARVQMPMGPVAGAQVWMRFERPGGMGGMMGSSGVVMLHDDGTHGDGQPGDGLYCLFDERDDYGCHGASAPMGDYRYEFWGSHSYGETNHMMVVVTVAEP